MNQSFNIFSASHVYNKMLIFGGHGSHFKNRTLTQMQRENIQPFILKAGDSINDQYNDNVQN